MNPCKVLALQDVTWKCNWKCKHCYFRRFDKSWDSGDTPLEVLKKEIDSGRARGCDEVALCGKGEPTLHSQVNQIIEYTTKVGMKSLIITNGSVGIERYRKLYDLGLDHLQVSMHGLGGTLDEITEREDAGQKQMKLLEWLNKENHPFRINITLQQLNCREILDIAKKAVQLGAFHISLLNFLPHYQWNLYLKEVAVNPVELVDMLEESMEYMEGKVIFTLRYFPMCLLRPNFWKYVTNTLYVLFDPWEWDYGQYSKDIEKVWESAVGLSETVRIKGNPCDFCLLKDHCGGWNKVYAQAFNFEGLKAIKEVPNELEEAVIQRGGLFDLNPANNGK